MNVPSIRPDVLHRALQRRGKPNLVDSFAASKTALIVVDMQNYFMEPGAAVEVPGARAIGGRGADGRQPGRVDPDDP